jgi:predicted small secreted protein
MCAALPDFQGDPTMKKLITLIAALGAVLSLQACNTIEGMGKDISKAGDKIEEAAKKK